jgi:peptide/nickel transport system substrate-binding protein
MHADPSWLRRPAVLGVVCLSLALIAGCTPRSATPSPTGTATQPRPFTVMTTGAITTIDPAVAVGRSDSILVTNVYQRLMQVAAGSGDLKPDAATDCAFTSRVVYECTLPDSLRFHNGDGVTADDVKFSIQRALRLDVPSTSIGLLTSLRRIETPNEHTVRFVLSREDSQFGYALAGQAASIVDHSLYDPDTSLPLTTLPVGSGPFSVVAVSENSASLSRFTAYQGPTTAQLDQMKFQVVADSVAAEAAITANQVDVAWACLDSSAQQRVDNEMAGHGGSTLSGFTHIGLPGLKVARLSWNEQSTWRSNTKLRAGVAKALQPDRSLDSVVPLGVVDRVKAFPLGGRPKLPKLKGKRINLTLGYDPADPGQSETARLLRDRIEALDGVSVRVTTSGKADLLLTTDPAWIDNALGWLQLYLAQPLGASKAKLSALEAHARAATGASRTADLSELQLQAATDNTVLPVSQSSGLLLIGPGVKLGGGSFGSGQQLGLWGFARG